MKIPIEPEDVGVPATEERDGDTGLQIPLRMDSC